MQTILVTGANGQLGNEMRRESQTSENHYLFTDMEELDITDLEAVRRMMNENKADVLVNCAAYTNVDQAEDNFETADLINHKAVVNLALACREAAATLIHISTDYVFQGDACLPYTEDHETRPLGVYGQTKLAGEQAIIAAGCKALIIRTAWLYSEFGHNFLKTMLKLTSEKKDLPVVFDQVGTPTYAGDLAAFITMIVDSELYRGREGIYHFSNEGLCSWYDFAYQIDQIVGNVGCQIHPCHSSQFPAKVKRPNFSVLDKTKVKQTFGIEIPYWRDSLITCINHLSSL